MDKYNQFLQFLEHHSDSAQGEIEHWAAKVIENPLHQLGWADDLFSAGGKLAAVRMMRYYVEGGDHDDLHAIVMKGVLERARHASHSSSETTNLLRSEEHKWLAILALEMKRFC